MSQGKLVLFLVVVAAFLGLGWAYQDALGDAEKYKGKYDVAAAEVMNLTDVKEKTNTSITITDKTSGEIVKAEVEIKEKIVYRDRVVDKKIYDIDKKYENIPPTIDTEKAKNTEKSGVRIAELWTTYCEISNDTSSCTIPAGASS